MTPQPIVNVLSPVDVEARRRDLLAAAGSDLYDLRDRAHDYSLSIEELEILRELERLEFLTGS
ncbi:hypothetical protein [Microbacterium arborescens]|uniref:hypothetical protein n=1 Tax=Microbacterium arborescens TaxID=33883 RepID=UPI002783C81A|nr:hypothetical protein [Microbacterium arborescens]MDQ1217179.1 hypothetical protein [Microbacterium arborescens]